ncbi:hypothetical protein HYH03_017395 [Edaphochlamys debaryana]|uniref:Uncharacterized protein n=1 Tax=Edaphochlamys debaryana TaxID=47281 RepID=A0A835XML4_9CHLO|nr:hypothetical protein HYH03_017395 [Edaphochlamys debaryana]|eukprot:KAG2483740.1 hypothetical protein HYH03_017395 [Edaphochlamys debaryana]
MVATYPDFSICEIGAATHASNATYDLPSDTPPPSPWLGFLLATPDLADPDGWDNAARSLAEGLRQSCIFMPSSLSHPKYACRRGDLQRNASSLGLTWRPDGGCAVPVYTELERQACLARLHVGPSKGKLCFLGDSHSRFLSHALNDWATNTSATRAEWYLNKAAPPEDYVQCVADPWASLPAGTASLRNCSVIVANTGQWQASYNTKAAPQNVTQYASNLRHWLGRVVDAARARRVPVLYALTVARPLQWQMFVGQDWRTDIVLEHYNFAAVQGEELWGVGGVIRNTVIHGICSTTEGPAGTPQQQRRERA